MGYRKLGRTSDQRKAMLRDLATSLIVSERIETTEARAKEVRSVVEKLITLGKKGDLASRRNAAKTLRNVEILNEDETTQTALQKLFGEIAERYAERQGGYTRILKVGPRRGDGAESVIIELVD
ncbi:MULTISPECIES: 50S ribosomal protein L17 [Staphylococcus]|jgi:large subunit ribosomal protein L17|uniref:Large ribosomal subunit protein bL17 n=1 Tax=Staphylococcus hominis TaxID=1290 RepID=A0A1L8Y7Y1_STAHO|nr:MULTISPECIES: 50S ribosomal protein L17 [Staphylococcus]EUZ68410.1 50S ribosomal protein L17 [Staphylococcus sp. M0480]OFK84166.1 50S ribosomal protein L17 [Staphylococcus sp. HMSC057A02]OFM57907.1 50S ribosomal protein L17 [Staphylococcus sp. HMSC059G05]OFM63282.1 50S ribosomal protein L17 [Staphylococcus sp. HMSC062C01]OFM63910.1 50S ribosomal protein L17 [Staphylococcus sp. HMSC068D07]OFM74286.1 50S ribosomal protein L17 [Staphylococcus sp. HMSC074B09]OFM93576.1 50S ribosomal protein L